MFKPILPIATPDPRFQTVGQLRAALHGLPDDLVLGRRDGNELVMIQKTSLAFFKDLPKHVGTPAFSEEEGEAQALFVFD